MRKLGGFGFILALAVLVIVLHLTGRAWRAVMPTASQGLRPGGPATTAPNHGQKEAGDAVRSGSLPGVGKMEQNTDEHIKRVKEAAQGQD